MNVPFGPQLTSVLSVIVKGVAMAELCRYPEIGQRPEGVTVSDHTCTCIPKLTFIVVKRDI